MSSSGLFKEWNSNMCFQQPKTPRVPEPKPLPKPVPVPVAPKQTQQAPKSLYQPGAKPDLRIGGQKSSASSNRSRSSTGQGLKSGLNIGNNSGLNI